MVSFLFRFFSRISPFYVIKLFSSLILQFSALFLVVKLKPEEYGKFSLIFTVSQLLFIITSGWNSGGVLYLGTKYYHRTGSYFNIIVYRTILLLAMLTIVIIISFIFRFEINSFLSLGNGFELVLSLYFCLLLFDFSSQILYPGDRYLIQSILELLFSLSLFSVIYFNVYSIESYIYTYEKLIFVFFVTTLTIFILLFFKFQFKFNFSEFIEFLNYSKWQAVSVFSIYVINLGSNFVFVKSNIDFTEIGVYNFSYRLFSGFSPVFGIFGILVPKWINTINVDKLKNILSRKIFELMVVLSLLYICVIISLPFILKLTGKLNFEKSIYYFSLLLPGFVFMGLGNLINTILMNTLLYKKAQLTSVLQGILLITFSSFFVYFLELGLIGSLISSTISFLIGFCYTYYLFKKKLNHSHF